MNLQCKCRWVSRNPKIVKQRAAQKKTISRFSRARLRQVKKKHQAETQKPGKLSDVAELVTSQTNRSVLLLQKQQLKSFEKKSFSTVAKKTTE